MPVHSLRVVGALLLLALAAPALSHADEFSDYRLPEHGYLNWNASGNGSGDHDSGSHGAYDLRSSRLQGQLSTAVSWFRESDRFTRSLRSSTRLSGIRDHDHQEGVTFIDLSPFAEPLGVREDRSRELDWQEDLSGSERRYWANFPWFLQGDISASVIQRNHWANDHFRSTSPSTLIERWYGTRDRRTFERLGMSVGIGIGRTRDVTPVFESRLIERRLIASGVLTRDLSSAARGRLAALVASRPDFESAQDLPARDFWKRLFAILRDDGALASEPDPAAAIRISDAYIGNSANRSATLLPFSPVNRTTGWSVIVSPSAAWSKIRFVTTNTESRILAPDTIALIRDDNVYPSLIGTSSTRLGLRGVVEYHRPLSMRDQFDVEAEYDQQLQSGNPGFLFRSDLSFTRIVAERWLATAGLSHAREVERNRDHSILYEDRTTRLFMQANYFIADHVAFTSAATSIWAASNIFGDARTDRQIRYSLGLTYRIAGCVDSPKVTPAP